MLESRDASLLAAIKTHVDTHGFGSAIMNDHVAIVLSGKGQSPGEVAEKIVRVRSLEEARCAIGCCCMKTTQ